MGTVIWSKTQAFYERSRALINNNVSRTDWIGFLDALGWMENEGKYGGISKAGYAGIYQVGTDQLKYMNFLEGLGKQFLGITSKTEVAKNPIAQELAGIMEFSGVPDIDEKNFVSKYYAVKLAARDSGYTDLYNYFDPMIGKTITISYKNAQNQIVGTETITLTQAGISAAAHLVGEGTMATAMNEIYKACFGTDAQGNLIQTASTVTLPTEGFGDGNHVAFSTYVKLLQDYNISSLLNAESDADFNQLVKDLIAYRKDKIINSLIASKQEAAMSISYTTNNYRETIRSIMQGLGLPTDNLNTINGKVVLAGANNSTFTTNADLIIGLGNVNNVLRGGKGNDILIGGEGHDTYEYKVGDGNDRIIDTGMNSIVIEEADGKKRTITKVYKTGAEIWTTDDGKIQINHHSPWKIVLEDGSTIELGENFQDGDFGIRLLETPDNPQPTNLITYTGEPIDDTAASDRIVGGDEADGIVASNGGNDWILGGGGDDAISTISGIVEGGLGSDIIMGGSDDSKLFGEDYGEMADLIDAGETAQSIAARGDLIGGGAGGNDQIYGSNANDALFGGEGHDLLVGAGGNDVIFGDDHCYGADGNWTASGTSSGLSLSNMIYEEGTFNGSDTIHAGTGNDYVLAGGGGDEVYGGEGADIVYGQGGHDFIDGGSGDDTLHGDAADVVLAEQGDDYIDGGAGADALYGYDGSDTLFGGDGDDYLQGDKGDDYLDGEAGVDTIVGGVSRCGLRI